MQARIAAGGGIWNLSCGVRADFGIGKNGGAAIPAAGLPSVGRRDSEDRPRPTAFRGTEIVRATEQSAKERPIDADSQR